jgi:acid phosphatase
MPASAEGRRPRLAPALIAVLAAFAACATVARAGVVPAHDRVVVVVMENKSYNQVRTQPYTMSLMAKGATFTKSFGVSHPSQPNYIALWAGSVLGVTNNNCPATGYPFSAPNLGSACEAAGLTWRAYSENLAAAGSTACSYDGSASSGMYTRTQFGNLNHANERPYTDLAADLASNSLPNLSFIVPNNCHNSHNSTTTGCGVPDADAWLAANMPAVIAALGPKGLLVVTWDEDDNLSNNQILTVFVGPQVLDGVSSFQGITHYTLVRVICEALGLTPFAGAAGEASITGVWEATVPAKSTNWGHVKRFYR